MELLTTSVLSSLALFVLGLCVWIMVVAISDKHKQLHFSEPAPVDKQKEKPVHRSKTRIIFYWRTDQFYVYDVPFIDEPLYKIVYVDSKDCCIFGSNDKDIESEWIAYEQERVETDGCIEEFLVIKIHCNPKALNVVNRVNLLFGAGKFSGKYACLRWNNTCEFGTLN